MAGLNKSIHYDVEIEHPTDLDHTINLEMIYVRKVKVNTVHIFNSTSQNILDTTKYKSIIWRPISIFLLDRSYGEMICKVDIKKEKEKEKEGCRH